MSLALVSGVFALDQVTKVWAVSELSRRSIAVIGDTVQFQLGRNTGSAFSLFQGFTPLLAVLAIAVAFVLARAARRSDDLVTVCALSLVLGGSLGNLADRLFRAPGFLHGAVIDFIDRGEFAGMMRKGGESEDEENARFKVSRAFAKRVKEVLGDAPDIVFEHVGKATFPTSVFTVKSFGKVVICAGTTGLDLDFNVAYLWMRQKEILGSHFANAYECTKANELIESGQIRPVLWRTLGFDGVAEAHQLMLENKHLGKISILIGAETEDQGKSSEGAGAIRAEVGA